MKQQVDSKRRDIEYQVGEFVFLKLHPYRQQYVFKRAYQKLASKFYGPYQIEEKIGMVAYKLKLPQGFRIHPVFHVSLLEKKLGETIATSAELPPMAEDGDLIMEQQKQILDTRWIKKGSKFVEESLIKWKRLPLDDATWENTQEVNDKFLDMKVEEFRPKEGVLICQEDPKSANKEPKVF